MKENILKEKSRYKHNIIKGDLNKQDKRRENYLRKRFPRNTIL